MNLVLPEIRGNFNVEGENVTGYKYIAHLYCLAVQAGFYGGRVLDFCAEGRGFDPRPGQDRRIFPHLLHLYSAQICGISV